MKKSEIFAKIMVLVSSRTDVSEEIIRSITRTEEALDARALVVYFCRKSGLSNKDIKSFFNRDSNHFMRRMCDLCTTRKKFSRYYSSIFAAIGTELGLNE